jgi:hypothetical protein
VNKSRSTRRLSVRVAAASVAAAFLALVTPAVALASAPAPAPTAPGSPSGWVRLGHLSPKTPPVDIYLSPFGQPQRVAFREAAYGAVTPYSSLAPGTYTVSMRPANAPASSPPALSANVDVKANTANTMLVFENGPNGTIRGQLLTDDLSAPPPGDGKVRLVNGTPKVITMDVSAVGGPTLASGLKYGDITNYVPLREGHWNIAVKNGDQTIASAMDMRAARACTLVAVEKPGAGLTLTQLPDSTGTASAPAGGADTGAGGTVERPMPVLPMLLVALVVGALTVTVSRVGQNRRQRRSEG